MINKLESLFGNEETKKEVLVHGITDKEVIHSIMKIVSAEENTVLFNIVVANLNNFKIINWLRKYKDNHNHYRIRTNPKCSSEFILIDDVMIFISGNSKEGLRDFNEETICIIEEQNKEVYQQLRDIFNNSWNQGYDLHL